MPVSSHKTQLTELYYANAAATVLKIGQVVGLGTFSSPTDDIDVTVLDSTAREFVSGFANNGDLTFPIVFHDQNASHMALLALKTAGTIRNWGIFGSQTATAPTAASSALVRPTTRTSWIFDAYVKDFTFEFEGNNVVRGTITLKPTGALTVTAAA